MRSDREFFEVLGRLHGHRCPMSILGARLGFAARATLGDRIREGQRLAARYYHRTCAIDGIQLATNCTLGNGNIEVEPRGEHRLTLWVQGSGDSVEVRLSPIALAKGRAYAESRQAAEGLDPDSPQGRRTARDLEAILTELEEAPDSELILFEPPAG